VTSLAGVPSIVHGLFGLGAFALTMVLRVFVEVIAARIPIGATKSRDPITR
jgi:ABC-type phosphate transport system permease subunit